MKGNWLTKIFRKKAKKANGNDECDHELNSVTTNVQSEEDEHQGSHPDCDGGSPEHTKRCCNNERLLKELLSAIRKRDTEAALTLLKEAPKAVLSTMSDGLSPLQAVCRLRDMNMLKILLGNSSEAGIRDELDETGNAALHVAAQERWYDGVLELLQRGASPDALCKTETNVKEETPLHAATRREDLAVILQMLQYHPDLSLKDNDGNSVLHLAARSHNDAIIDVFLQEKLCQEMLTTRDNDGNTVIHTALKGGAQAPQEDKVLETIRIFIEAGADVNCSNHNNETPLFLAASSKMLKVVELLLQVGGDPTITTHDGKSVLHAACQTGSDSCLLQFLATGQVSSLITYPDSNGLEPFHYAVNSCSIDCCKVLLNKGDHLAREDDEGLSRCLLMLSYLPSATHFLKQLFDDCISVSSKTVKDPDVHVTFDYSALISPDNDTIQTSFIKDIKDTDAESLLKHPLLESFLYSKWEKIKYIIFSNFLLFFTFLLIHTVYIVVFYKQNPMFTPEDAKQIGLFRSLHIFVYVVILFKEVIVFLGTYKSYPYHWESLTTLLALISSAFVVFSTSHPNSPVDLRTQANSTSQNVTNLHEGQSHVSVERTMAAVSGFFGWLELMMLLSRFPHFGVQVLMFSRIARSILQFTLAFLGLLIGFTVSFMVLFHTTGEFSSFYESLVKTLMMMIGEIDYSGLVDGDTPYISYVFLVLFVFLVCILMINLLIGLAVNDIAGLQKLGEIERLYMQASYVHTYVSVMTLAQKWKFFPNKLISFLCRRLRVDVQKKIGLNKRRFSRKAKYSIPSHIVETALSICKAKTSTQSKLTIEQAAETLAMNMLNESIRRHAISERYIMTETKFER